MATSHKAPWEGKHVPVTPGGTILFELAARTEGGAWKKLISVAPYPTIKALKWRGYTVERMVEAKP